MKQEALQAKQSMFARHSGVEKGLREHKELLAGAREELAGQRSLAETLRANAKNLRQQLGACTVTLSPPCTGQRWQQDALGLCYALHCVALHPIG